MLPEYATWGHTHGHERSHSPNQERESGQRGVSVPRFSDAKKCEWRKRPESDRRYVWLPFSVMLDVMEFALEHAIVQMPDGSLRRQRLGIPMGDPLSPGMTVITCAWMEHKWLKTKDTRDKTCFAARRFMDDILMRYAKPRWWDHERFLHDFTRSD